VVVLGLLQTEEYSRATFRNGPRELDHDEVERRVEVCMARRRSWAAITGRGCGLWSTRRSSTALSAPKWCAGSSAQQGKTTIQVVPYRTGAHAGTTGPFVILDFPEPTDAALVYVETLAGDIYLEQRSDVNRYTLAFDRLIAAARHPDESVRLIDQASSGMT
jgi:hypothetical protein